MTQLGTFSGWTDDVQRGHLRAVHLATAHTAETLTPEELAAWHDEDHAFLAERGNDIAEIAHTHPDEPDNILGNENGTEGLDLSSVGDDHALPG